MSNEDNVSNNFETPNMERKKSKIFIPIIIVVILIALIGVGGIYYYLSSKPEKIVTNMINTIYDNYQTAYNKQSTIDFEGKPILIDGNFKINSNIPGLEDLDKEQINFEVGVDYENKKFLGGLSLTEDSNKIIEIIYYIINNQMYLKFDEYEKLIKVNNEVNSFNFDEIFTNDNTTISPEDTNYLVTEFKNILIDSIDGNDFKKSTDTIEINNEERKVNKLTYELNETNLKKLDETLSKNLLKNEKLLEKISEISNINIEELKTSLESTTDEYENLGEFNIYTKKITNKLAMIEYSYNGIQIQIYFDENINKISIKQGLYSIDFDIITNTSEKLDMNYTINYGIVANGNLTITSKQTNDKYEGTIDYNFKYLNYSLGLTGTLKIEANENIFNIDTDNAVDENSLDQSTLTNIMENIMLKLQNSNLNKILEGFGTNTDETNSLI